MKNLFASLCLLIAVPAFAAPVSYVTEQNEDGLYCARVKVNTVGFTTVNRTYCRTILEWQNRGYEVSIRTIEEQ